MIEVDQGGLREGSRVVRYRAPLPAGGGMSVFEDDVYLPPRWRSLAWAVRSGEITLASGSFDPRVALSPLPLQLVSADKMGGWRALFGGDARVVEVAGNLPERAAAYDGVETLLLDGTAAAPRPQALLAAAAGGVKVLLAGPLPQSFEPLSALAPLPAQRVGSGWLVRGGAGAEAGVEAGIEAVGATLASLDLIDAPALARALLTPDLLEPPDSAPTRPLLFGLAGYLLVTFLLIRFGGTPGLLTALAVVPLASLAAWGYARPSSASPVRSRSLSIGADGLAYAAEVRTLFRFAGGEVTGPADARLVDTDILQDVNPVSEALRDVLQGVSPSSDVGTMYERTPEGLRFTLPRWSAAALLLAPKLEPARLSLRDDSLVNAGADTLVDVYVIGSGVQEDVPPDSTHPLRAGAEDTRELPLVYRELLPRLPEGSAVARQGGRIFVALPEGRRGQDVSQGRGVASVTAHAPRAP